MSEVNVYINRFKKDQEYKDSIRKFGDRIRNMQSTEGLECNYGQLMFEGPMTFKKQNETRYNNNCYLMCFQARILIFEIEDQDDLNGIYQYMDSIMVTSNMNVLVERKKNEGIITVQTHDKFVINNRESFNIKVSTKAEKGQKALAELEDKFKKLIEKAAPRPCNKHKLHDFQTCLTQHEIDIKKPKPPPVCEECNKYLYGQIFLGYKCEDCEGYYHEHCFIEGSQDPYMGKLRSRATLIPSL